MIRDPHDDDMPYALMRAVVERCAARHGTARHGTARMNHPQKPALIYLHGFASSPSSTKAKAFVAWVEPRGASIDVLDLRVPSFEHLRFSAMKAATRAAIDRAGGERARVVLIGSSLGGLTALRVAEEDARVAAVFAMAPALRLAERWRAKMDPAAWDAWKRDDFLEVDARARPGSGSEAARADEKSATKKLARVDFGFVEELGQLDSGGEGWPDVRVPVCIVHGTRDSVVDVELSRAWARERPHVRLVEVDDEHELGASISRILEEAEAFLRPFLGSSGSSGIQAR